jgi:protein TonB
MFDNVGKDLDEEATKRNAASVVMAAALIGGVIAASLVITAIKVTEAVMDASMDDGDMIEIVMDDPSLDEAPPPPPPPPPPPAASSEPEDEEEEDEEDPQDNPDEMTDDVAELEEDVEDKVRDDKTKGQVGGVEGGVEGGVVGGVVGGVIGGELGGVLGGVRTFHHSEVEVKRRVQPDYPSAAESMNLGDVSCRVRVFIDETGVPYNVKIEACPKVFHDTTQQALLKWRWYPAKVDGSKVKAQFLLVVNYKQR